MNATADRGKEIAATIYKQIGGNSFKAMVGGYNFIYSKDKNDLSFMFRMCRKANVCSIVLNSMDLYDMTFAKLNKASGKYDEVESFSGLYFDSLESTFERFTGLRTRL